VLWTHGSRSTQASNFDNLRAQILITIVHLICTLHHFTLLPPNSHPHKFIHPTSIQYLSSHYNYTVVYLLKARTVEPEKQPLLGNAHKQQQRRCHDTWHIQLLLWSDWISTYVVRLCNNRRGVASDILCGPTPRLCDSTDEVQFREWVQCSWEFSCGELTSRQWKLKIRYQETCSENIAEEQPLLRAVTE
jgi:hypothetical protein